MATAQWYQPPGPLRPLGGCGWNLHLYRGGDIAVRIAVKYGTGDESAGTRGRYQRFHHRL